MRLLLYPKSHPARKTYLPPPRVFKQHSFNLMACPLCIATGCNSWNFPMRKENLYVNITVQVSFSTSNLPYDSCSQLWQLVKPSVVDLDSNFGQAIHFFFGFTKLLDLSWNCGNGFLLAQIPQCLRIQMFLLIYSYLALLGIHARWLQLQQRHQVQPTKIQLTILIPFVGS